MKIDYSKQKDMLRLPEELSKYGYSFKLIIRCENKAIYSQSLENLLIAYEVIKIRIRPPRFNRFLSREDPAMETYPSNEQWGKLGWTCRTWEEALERYNLI